MAQGLLLHLFQHRHMLYRQTVRQFDCELIMRNFSTYRDAMKFIRNAGLSCKPIAREVWLGQFGLTKVWSVMI